MFSFIKKETFSSKLMTEFIGTMLLVTVVSFTGNPLAVGAVLAALVYSGAHISGAHYNPAVTFGLFLKKKISSKEAVPYVIVQMLGGLSAAALSVIVRSTIFVPQPAVEVPWLVACVVEMLGTFLLVRTILTVAADSRVKGNQYFGLAIGSALMAAAFLGGPISGGAFNPAVGVSPLLFDLGHLAQHLSSIVLYIVGPLLGAALAAFSVEE